MIRLLTIWSLVFFCVSVRAQVSIITTIAGTGVAGYSGDGGLATTARLFLPNSLCLNDSGDVLFSDAFNHRIRRIDITSGIISTIAGVDTPGYSGDDSLATNSSLFLPEAVACDIVGNLYISDALNYRIRKIDVATGLISTIAGDGISGNAGDAGIATDAQFLAATGLAIYGDNLYVADLLDNRVRKVDLSSHIITTVAGNGSAGYFGDEGLATDAKLNGPNDIFVDKHGDLYIADGWNNVIRKVYYSIPGFYGKIYTVAGNGSSGYSGDGGQATDAKMNEPGGVFVDGDDYLYVADYRNGAIRLVNPGTGTITTVVGGEFGYGGDGGLAANAKLKCTDVWVSDNKDIYVADYANNRIRKVSSGVVVSGVYKRVEANLYPNPTQGVFSIQTPLNFSVISVYNAAGLEVYHTTLTTMCAEVDISDQPPGTYMVYIKCADKTYASKMVKLD